MLKADIKRIDEKRMHCSVECTGSVLEIVSETSALVKSIKESLADNKEAELTFKIAISSVLMDMPVENLMKKLKEE